MIEVVKVHGWIAMGRDQPDRRGETGFLGAFGQHDLSVFIAETLVPRTC